MAYIKFEFDGLQYKLQFMHYGAGKKKINIIE